MESFVRFCTSPVPFIIIFAGVFFSFYLKFFYITHPKTIICGMLEAERRNGVSPFRAVSLALSGTLGVGNIVGVAGAIAIGGFGSVFWMWISALCAMVLKYAEITLSLSHSREQNGERFGGAFYYMEDFFSSRGLLFVGRVVGTVFAALCFFEVVSTGCGIQITAAAGALNDAVGAPKILVGIFAAILTLYAVGGGAKKVSGVTARLIPLLSALYILVSLAALGARADELPRVFSLIFEGAFKLESAAGGIFGFLFSSALRAGAMRGLLSNEAGCGTSPLAHASSSASEPAKQGFFGIFEVFFDTIVLCTITAAVIIISYDDASAFASEPVKLAIAAYSFALGDWAGLFLSFSLAAFGIATVVCCAHYAKECAFYIFGKRSKSLAAVCLALYSGAAVLGSVTSSEILWAVSDISLAFMTALNVCALIFMRREIKELTERYLKKKKK